MKCTGLHCPMQHGYDVEDCMLTNCKYRTIPGTNFERIKSMSVEEMAAFLLKVHCDGFVCGARDNNDRFPFNKEWLESEVEENDK